VNLRLQKATVLDYCNGHQVYRRLKSVDLTAWTLNLYLFMKMFLLYLNTRYFLKGGASSGLTAFRAEIWDPFRKV